jgi:hypothetical protein
MLGSSPIHRALVFFGASSPVGAALARGLVERGVGEVRALRRWDEPARLAGHGDSAQVSWAVAQEDDSAALGWAFQGCDVAFYAPPTLGAVREEVGRFRRVLGLAREAQLRRVVLVLPQEGEAARWLDLEARRAAGLGAGVTVARSVEAALEAGAL